MSHKESNLNRVGDLVMGRQLTSCANHAHLKVYKNVKILPGAMEDAYENPRGALLIGFTLLYESVYLQ